MGRDGPETGISREEERKQKRERERKRIIYKKRREIFFFSKSLSFSRLPRKKTGTNTKNGHENTLFLLSSSSLPSSSLSCLFRFLLRGTEEEVAISYGASSTSALLLFSSPVESPSPVEERAEAGACPAALRTSFLGGLLCGRLRLHDGLLRHDLLLHGGQLGFCGKGGGALESLLKPGEGGTVD